jgi:transcription antitermination factor NusG
MAGSAAIQLSSSVGQGLRRDPALVAAGYRWHVLHTRSRQEKVIAETLAAAGAYPFLPLQRRVTYYGHRKRVVEAPLFTCYLFVWGLLDHAYLATGSRRAAQVIGVDDQKRLETELTHLERVINLGGSFQHYDLLIRGRRVRVTRGPFEGIEGIVEDGVRNDRLVLQVHAIGRALSLEIDASLLEPVD